MRHREDSTANYSRPASGFRYKFEGVKTNAAPDALPTNKYNIALNVRATADDQLRSRPGMSQVFATDGNPVTDLRAYVALNTDSKPRILARGATDKIWLDDGTQVGTLAGGGASPGATFIPFRPNQSANPYMYVANGNDYQKFSAPLAGVGVNQYNVGIIEPQAPADASVSAQFESFIGTPGPNGFTGVSIGQRINDVVKAIFPDPNGTQLTTLQVVGGFGSLAPGLYLGGTVIAHFWNVLPGTQGAFDRAFPLNTASSVASARGNSLQFNPTAFNGTFDPNVEPIEWATLDQNGNIVGYFVPWSGANENWEMTLQVPIVCSAAGNYGIQITHDDGMIFAISGATLVSGAQNDPFWHHTQTAVAGLSFVGGGVAGTNLSGSHIENFVVNFPAAGVYSLEIDYCQWANEQNLNAFWAPGSIGGTLNKFVLGGTQSYQRDMAVLINGTGYTVQDVFPALPQGLDITGIFYYDQVALTGRCVVVPTALRAGPGTEGQSLYDQSAFNGLRRGALIVIGSEVCYVLSTTVGPDGTISFETSTVGTHTASENLSGVSAISILGTGATVGAAITSPDIQFGCLAGITTHTSPLAVSPFVSQTTSFSDEDYLHFSLNIDNLSALIEMKLLFDVGDGTFTQDFYYYTVRPSDIAAGVQNLLTQLGVAQIVSQRAAIDEERAALAHNKGDTFSSSQTVPGSSQWSEIKFPISELTRVGNAQEKTLQNVNAVQVLCNCTGSVSVLFNSLTVTGGYSPDVGNSGAPYQYIIRPRSSVTGVKGNPAPAMRYGVNPRRQQVTVPLPVTYVDPQVDTWDVFRYGGSITSYRFIGSVPIGAATFLDNYGDDAATEGEALDYDNFEPWPSVDVPYNIVPGTVGGITTGVQVVGTTVLVIFSSASPFSLLSFNVLSYLPGNLVRIGTQNVYTLWTRPTQVTLGTPPQPNYVALLFQLTQNAGNSAGQKLSIYEPQIAKRNLPYMWGPDANGTLFACGDELRPGTVYFAKNYTPDSAPDSYNVEITAPSEPLLGGEILDGVSYVASTERWWRLYSQGTQFLNPQNVRQHYSALQQPFPRGLAAPRGHCNDGQTIFWWAKDGIYSSSKGSLTDADLFNLFPHDAVPGQEVTYAGFTFFPPDYERVGSFRIAYVNGYLRATYQDSSGTYRTLILDIKRMAWSVDESPASRVTVAYAVEQPPESSGNLNPELLLGTVTGIVAQEEDLIDDLGQSISCIVASGEWDAGDIRAAQQWGDIMLNCLPSASSGITATPMSQGAALVPATAIPTLAQRQQFLVSLLGEQLTNFLGLLTTWTEDYVTPGAVTTLFIWQPTYIPKPETIADRFTDWYQVQDSGAAGYVQGFVLHADTVNAIKVLAVRDSDTLQLHPFTPVVNHNGESIKAYSFNTPFIAHQVRIEPQDQIHWRFFNVEWVAEPTPEVAEHWESQGTSFELNGYSHIQRVVIAYASVDPVTLTITSFDGQSPVPITLPSTGGAYKKQLMVCSANKGQLYFFKATCPTPFQLYLDDCEVLVGGWGRASSYLTWKSLGGRRGDKARI